MNTKVADNQEKVQLKCTYMFFLEKSYGNIKKWEPISINLIRDLLIGDTVVYR